MAKFFMITWLRDMPYPFYVFTFGTGIYLRAATRSCRVFITQALSNLNILLSYKYQPYSDSKEMIEPYLSICIFLSRESHFLD